MKTVHLTDEQLEILESYLRERANDTREYVDQEIAGSTLVELARQDLSQLDELLGCLSSARPVVDGKPLATHAEVLAKGALRGTDYVVDSEGRTRNPYTGDEVEL